MFKRAATAGLLPALIVSAVLAMAFIAPPGTSRLAVGTCSYPYNLCATITSVTPDRGTTAGGTTVTIAGTHFTGTTAVSFGGVAATSFAVVNDTTITAVTPAHATATVDVTVTTPVSTTATSQADHYSFVPKSHFVPRPPLRLWDTRSTGVHLHAGDSLTLQLAGISVPSDATAVALNVTVTNTTTAGFLIVYPTGSPRPLSSNLNWTPRLTVPNLVVVAIGDAGQVTFYNGPGTTDVVVDLEGWFEPNAVATDGEFVSLAPHRITDTRNGSGQPNSGLHLGPGSTLNVQVLGAGGVPATGAESVILNVTVTNTSSASFLTVYPTGTSLPLASNLNWPAHKTVPNRVSVPIGAGGMVSIYNGVGSVDVIVDVNGYFTDATLAGTFFLPLTPSRILDTRTGNGGFTVKVAPGQTIHVDVAGRGGVPTIASATPPSAVVINVTVTGPTAPGGFLTIFPDLTSLPIASDLNFVAGQTVPNLVFVKLGTNGKISLYNGVGSTDVVIDVVGWFDTGI